MKPLTAARLRELFSYDPATGVFTRRAKIGGRFAVGAQVGHLSSNGYVRFSVDGEKYAAHRLAWLYMTGAWPKADIDHIDGDRANNRFANLRDVPRAVNLQNLKAAKSHNKSTGLLGAYPCGARFTSRIQANGTDHYLGTFSTAEAAHAAYIDAKRELHEGSTL